MHRSRETDSRSYVLLAKKIELNAFEITATELNRNKYGRYMPCESILDEIFLEPNGTVRTGKIVRQGIERRMRWVTFVQIAAFFVELVSALRATINTHRRSGSNRLCSQFWMAAQHYITFLRVNIDFLYIAIDVRQCNQLQIHYTKPEPWHVSQ